MRLAANDLKRRIKKCAGEESAQLERLRRTVREGNRQLAQVHAENVIRRRNELVRLHHALGQVVALNDRLKQLLLSPGSKDMLIPCAQAQDTLRADAAEVKESIAGIPVGDMTPVSAVQTQELIHQLEDELAFEAGTSDRFASVASQQQDELMERLRSLRKP